MPLDLLKNRNSLASLQFSDGRVAANYTLDNNEYFITSPNCDEIPEPPLGVLRNIVRCEDGLYGHDDYLQWPQPFHRAYCHLCAIPRCPSPESSSPYRDHGVLWTTLYEHDVDITESLPKSGTLRLPTIHAFTSAVDALRPRVVDFQKKYEPLGQYHHLAILADTYMSIVDTTLLRLRNINSLRDIWRGVAELRRAWLSCAALIDYMDIFKSRMQTGLFRPENTEERIGAFTTSAEFTRSLFNAGIPVYYIRPANEFSQTNVLKAVSVYTPQQRHVCVSPSRPCYPVIFTGQADAEGKYNAILQHAITCFNQINVFADKKQSDFDVLLSHRSLSTPSAPPSLTPSTSAAGPSRSLASLPQRPAPYPSHSRHSDSRPLMNSEPANQPNLFQPLPATDLAPQPIPAWVAAVTCIDTRLRQRSSQHAQRKTAVPPPNIFFDGQGNIREGYMLQWYHFRDVWFQRSCTSACGVELVPTSVWRKVLEIAQRKGENGLWNPLTTPRTAQQKLVKTASDLLTSTFRRFSSDSECIYREGTILDQSTIRNSLWQICQINFCAEVHLVDYLCDTSRPRPSPNQPGGSYKLLLASHVSKWEQLMDQIFSGAKIFAPNSTNLGVVSPNPFDRFKAIHALWTVMQTWPLVKPSGWNTSHDFEVSPSSSGSQLWQAAVIQYYLQNAFNVLEYCPSLPFTP